MAEKGIYGRGFTASDMASALLKADDTKTGSFWTEASDALSLSYSKSLESVNRQYDEAILQAYRASEQNKQFAGTYGLVGLGRGALISSQDAALMEAYNTYKMKQAEQQSELYQNYLSGQQNLQAALQERAENFVSLEQSYYDYAKYIYDEYYGNRNANIQNPFDVNAPVNWNWLLTQSYDEEGNPVVDEEGNPIMELRNRQDLYSELYDEHRNLTGKGTMFYDLIENRQYQGVTSYGQWLQETNPELYSWAYDPNQNIYDSSSDNTNAGTFRELTGRSSTDYDYTWIEHVAALDEGEIKSVFEPMTEKLNELANVNMKDKAAGYLDAMKPAVQEVKKLALELGIYQDMERMGVDWNKLMSLPEEMRKQVKTGGQMAENWFRDYLFDTALAGIAGFVGGSAVPVIGNTAGAVLGLAAGATGGIVHGSVDVDEQRKSNEITGNYVRDTFSNLMRAMTQFAVERGKV